MCRVRASVDRHRTRMQEIRGTRPRLGKQLGTCKRRIRTDVRIPLVFCLAQSQSGIKNCNRCIPRNLYRGVSSVVAYSMARCREINSYRQAVARQHILLVGLSGIRDWLNRWLACTHLFALWIQKIANCPFPKHATSALILTHPNRIVDANLTSRQR